MRVAEAEALEDYFVVQLEGQQERVQLGEWYRDLFKVDPQK